MSTPEDGAFGASLQFAADQARVWVPHWLAQLKQALRLQEQEARSFVEKQAMGQSRSVLAQYHDEVAKRFLAEIAQVIKDAATTDPTPSGAQRPSPLDLDALSLVDHDAVQEKVALTRVQQVVRMAAEEALPALDALLSRARGFEVVRTDVNPLHPDAIVAALSRALATLHLDDAVRAQWLQTGAVLLGAELTRFYGAMATALLQQGVKPAGYVVVQRNEGRQATASDPDRRQGSPADAPQRSGPNLSLDHLHALLASTLKASSSGDTSQSGQSQGLACSLASEVVTQMMHRWATDHRLLKNLRDMVQGLQPSLMQLARAQPGFFADPANPARRLLDAMALQGAAFVNEFDPGFVEFANRTHRVLGALQTADGELPSRLVAALQRFRGPPLAQPSLRKGQARGPALQSAQRSIVEDGSPPEEVSPAFMDTVPMERELMPMELSQRSRAGAPASAHRLS